MAARLRCACHTIATNIAAMSGTSVSSSSRSLPRTTVQARAAPVTAITTSNRIIVVRSRQTRKP
jgi:hypothetical protein